MYLLILNEEYFVHKTSRHPRSVEYEMTNYFETATKFEKYEDAKEVARIFGGVIVKIRLEVVRSF